MRILGMRLGEAMASLFCLLFIVGVVAMAIDARWLAWPFIIYAALCIGLVAFYSIKNRHVKTIVVHPPGDPARKAPGPSDETHMPK